MTPSLEVIIPVRNGGSTLEYTLQTCRDQIVDDASFLISDNCSSDATPEIIRKFAQSDPRFRAIRTPRPSSYADSFEWALDRASGDFVMLVGSDDALYPGCLTHARQLMIDHPNCAGITGTSAAFYYPTLKPCDGVEPGVLRVQVGSDPRMFSGKNALRQHALALADCALPALYGGWMRLDVLRSIKRRTGRFVQYDEPDSWFAYAAAAEDVQFLTAPIPMMLSGLSPSSGHIGFYHDEKSVGWMDKLALEKFAERTNLAFRAKSPWCRRFNIYERLLSWWDDAPFTHEGMAKAMILAMHQDWKCPCAAIESIESSQVARRSFLELIAMECGLKLLLDDLDAGGDLPAIRRKWQIQPPDTSEAPLPFAAIRVSNLLDCPNIVDVSRLLPAILEAQSSASLAWSQFLRSTPGLAMPPPHNIRAATARMASSHPVVTAVKELVEHQFELFSADSKAEAKRVKQLNKDLAREQKEVARLRRILDQEWRNPASPWPLRLGFWLARLLRKIVMRSN